MIIIQAGHEGIQGNCDPLLRGGTGAPGEIDWTPQVAQRVVDLLNGVGVDARHVDANFNCAGDVGVPYDAFLAIHYQSDPPHESGFFVGVMDPAADDNAAGSAALADAIRGEYAADIGLQWRPNWNSKNILGYYMFRSLAPSTPGALIECGTGAPGAPDHDFLWGNIESVSRAITDGILAFLNRPELEEETPMTQAEFDALLHANPDFQALIWRVKAITDGQTSIEAGPTAGTANQDRTLLLQIARKLGIEV